MRIVSYLVALLVFLLGLGFSLLNPQTVHFNYFWSSQDCPLSFLLVCSFVLGVFMGGLMVLPMLLRLRYRHRAVKKKMHQVQQ